MACSSSNDEEEIKCESNGSDDSNTLYNNHNQANSNILNTQIQSDDEEILRLRDTMQHNLQSSGQSTINHHHHTTDAAFDSH